MVVGLFVPWSSPLARQGGRQAVRQAAGRELAKKIKAFFEGVLNETAEQIH